ncbi:MAG: aminopeptidase, partial [Anaerolineae bacterium]|nr:aminopeptidase [Anaerolineae bacterium]
DQQGINAVQWTVICPPTPDWATKIFPDISEDAALSRLWEAVFKACRLNDPDPIVFWEGYLANLAKRREYLTSKKYTALKFKASGTDLWVGLPKGHLWAGGKGKSSQDIPFAPNLPTEEVFTLPHKDQTEGTVTATKPLNYYGSLVENFKLTFSEGKVVDFSAEKGEDVLKNILAMDENASFLGEVALIPHKSPISQSGLIFMNTLYDENASNHLALGSAYQFTLKGGETMSVDEFAQAGGNDSLIHIDFMFGSGDMDVDGVTADGKAEPVMRAGEWAFDV